jgi:predicted glycoside hydrolase/deacetylase ChbG (UPF0249 family)
VNVDDLGMTDGVNRAVADAHRAGIVTSASLMVDGAAAAGVPALARHHPDVSIGLHVQFTHEDGELRIDAADAHACREELARQVAAFERLVGRPPTHLDSHHNVHRRRSLLPLFVEAAEQLDVPLREHSVVTWFGSFYAAWDGETHPEQVTFESLRSMLAGFGDGVTELCTHVAHVEDDLVSEYRVERALELSTILDPRLPGAFAELGIELISYQDARARQADRAADDR